MSWSTKLLGQKWTSKPLVLRATQELGSYWLKETPNLLSDNYNGEEFTAWMFSSILMYPLLLREYLFFFFLHFAFLKEHYKTPSSSCTEKGKTFKGKWTLGNKGSIVVMFTTYIPTMVCLVFFLIQWSSSLLGIYFLASKDSWININKWRALKVYISNVKTKMMSLWVKGTVPVIWGKWCTQARSRWVK